jgi:topoisomerase-4 subunit A
MKLKGATDELINVYLTDEQEQLDAFLVTNRGFGLRYPLTEVPVVGAKAAGVKAINLKDDDYVVSGQLVYSQGDAPLLFISQRGAVKRMLAQEIPQLGRAKRGLQVFRELKSNPHRVVYVTSEQNGELLVTSQKGTTTEVEISNVPIGERTSNGSFIMDEKVEGQVLSVWQKIDPVIQENS